MRLSDKLETKLADLRSFLLADPSKIELIRLDVESGQITEQQALKRLVDYGRQLRFGQAAAPAPQGDPTLWRSKELQVFISHRGTQGPAVARLAAALEPYGVACFLSHDAIEPTKAWRDAITTALRTMHALVAFVSDDFHESPWTMQEVGFGLGRGVPCVGLMVETRKPPGLLGASMALKADLSNLTSCAAKLAALLVSQSGRRGQVVKSLISKLLEAKNPTQLHDRLSVLVAVAHRLEEDEVDRLVVGIDRNDHLRSSLEKSQSDRRRLLMLLNERSRAEFEWRGGALFRLFEAARP